MDYIKEQLTQWLKEILVGGITSNLSGMFDSVNQKVGEIATQVGQTPQGWNGGVFNMIRSLSETAILPIAGLILAFVMTLELIQLITDKNNLHDVDTWMFFKWIFKTACAVLIVTNTWSIVMGVFDVAQSVVNSASGVVAGNASIDISSVTADLDTRLMEMDLGPLFGLWFQSLFVGIFHLYFHHRLWPHGGNLPGHIRCAYPHGDHGQPGMGADGPELPAFPVRPGLPGVPHHCLCRHLRGAGAGYCNGN